MAKGMAWRFGKDIDTDRIIPARHLISIDPAFLAKHCMEDEDPKFAENVKEGDIIVADKNFGCGSSREHAPIAIKGAGISCVIAESFARIFYRNAFNMGIPIFESPEAVKGIKQGDKLDVNFKTGEIKNLTSGKTFQAAAIPPFMEELLAAGGLMAWVKKRVAAKEKAKAAKKAKKK